MDRQIEKRNIFTKAMDTLNKGLSVLEAQISKLFGRKLEKPAGEGIHLSGMDRVVEKTPWQQYRKFIIYGGGAVTLLLMILIFMPEGGRALKVQNDRIVISEVIEGEFDDYIPVRAQVAPLKTVYLDAIDGGRVEATYIEDGATVEAGQLLVVLSNTSLQLDVISR